MSFADSLFNKRKTYYFSSSFHLGEVDDNEVSDAIMAAILTGSSITQALQQLTFDGLNTRVPNLRNYANREYTLGLPEVLHKQSFTLPDATIASIIAQDIDHPDGVQIEFQYTSPMVESLAIAPHLLYVRGCKYNNTVTNIPVGYRPEPRIINRKTVITCVVEGIEADELFSTATIKYKITERLGPTTTHYYWSETVPIPTGLYPHREYYIVGYRLLDAQGSPVPGPDQWWYYDLSSDEYPEICPEKSIDEGNNLLPVVPLRYNNKDLTREEVRDTELYKTSKRLLNMVNVDIDGVAAEINKNPDVAEIDHAYIMFGVDVQTEEIASLKYLVAFFDYVIDKALIDGLDFYKSILGPDPSAGGLGGTYRYSVYDFRLGRLGVATGTTTDSTITVGADGSVTVSIVKGNPSWGAFEEFGLNMSIGYGSIRSEVRTGSIGPIGHVTKTLVRENESWSYFKTKVPEGSSMVLCEQITATTYRRISVFGLFLSNYINYPRGVVITLTEVIDDPDQHGLIIPLHYNVVRQMKALERNNVYKDSLMLVLNSVKSVKIKWYQTTAFRFILQAALVVYTVLTLPTGIGPASAVVIFKAVATRILVTVAISISLNAIASWIGPDAAMIVAAVTAVAALTYGNPSMSITVPGASLPTAVTFLDLSLALMNSANVEIQRQIGEVGKEQTKFNKEKELLLEKLEEAEKLLPDTDTMVDVTNLLGAQTHSATLWQAAPGDPEKFYELTIHTGNIGVLALSGPSTFYDRALRLPEPDIRMRR